MYIFYVYFNIFATGVVSPGLKVCPGNGTEPNHSVDLTEGKLQYMEY